MYANFLSSFFLSIVSFITVSKLSSFNRRFKVGRVSNTKFARCTFFFFVLPKYQVIFYLDRLDSVIQSYHDLPAQADLTIHFTSISPSELLKPLVVSGRKNLNPKLFLHIFQYLERKRGYLDISRYQGLHHDKACLPLSIAVAIYFGEPYTSIKSSNWWRNGIAFPDRVTDLAKNIYETLGQDYNTSITLTPSTMDLIQTWLNNSRFEKKLKIFLLKSDTLADIELFYDGSTVNDNDATLIQLLITQEHVGLITSDKDFFNGIVFCNLCQSFVKKGKKHSCVYNKKCHLCQSPDCQGDDGSRKISCPKCNRRFKVSQCYY